MALAIFHPLVWGIFNFLPTDHGGGGISARGELQAFAIEKLTPILTSALASGTCPQACRTAGPKA